MHNAALAAGASVSFTLYNSVIYEYTCLILSGLYVSVFPGNYRIEVGYVNTVGQAQIRVTNISAGPLSEALIINFATIKGAIS